MNTRKIKISCLPVAGIGNPYQHLMIEGLKKHTKLAVKNGISGKLFGIINTCIFQNPDYIHFDWINGYYQRSKSWITYLSIFLFICQILAAKYFFKCKIVWTVHNLCPHDAVNLKLHQRIQIF